MLVKQDVLPEATNCCKQRFAPEATIYMSLNVEAPANRTSSPSTRSTLSPVLEPLFERNGRQAISVI